MKKFLNGIYITAILFSFFTLSSCHNMCEDLKSTIGDVCWYDKLEWKDVSKTLSISSGASSRFSSKLENGQYVITSTDSGNWGFGNASMNTKGYEAEVKLNSGSYVGIQLFGYGYNCYYVLIRKNNTVEVYYDIYSGMTKINQIKYCTIKNCVSDSAEYNKIKLEIQKDRTCKVYINDEEVCTIPDNNFSFGSFYIYSGGKCNFKVLKLLY